MKSDLYAIYIFGIVSTYTFGIYYFLYKLIQLFVHLILRSSYNLTGFSYMSELENLHFANYRLLNILYLLQLTIGVNICNFHIPPLFKEFCPEILILVLITRILAKGGWFLNPFLILSYCFF